MRTSLIMVAALTGGALFATEARAQFAAVVTDVAAEANTLETSITAGKQLVTADQQLTKLGGQLDQLTNLNGMLRTPTNALGMLPDLDRSAIENAMPPASGLPAQINGTSPSVSTYAVTLYDTNKTLSTGIEADALNQSVRSAANLGGTALSNLDALEARAAGLAQMKALLDTAQTFKAVTDLGVRVGIENVAAQTATAQATNLVAAAIEQTELNRLREAKAMYDEHAQTADLLVGASVP